MVRSKASKSTIATVDASDMTAATETDINPLYTTDDTMTDTLTALETADDSYTAEVEAMPEEDKPSRDDIIYTAPESESSSPMWDYVLEHSLTPEQMGQALLKFYAKYDLNSLNTLWNEQYEGTSVTLLELFEAFENTKQVFQADISPVNVKSILSNVKQVGCFTEPISLSVHPDGSLSIAGGRNRFEALASILRYMFDNIGADVDSIAEDVRIPVSKAKYLHAAVVNSNTTRNMTPAEKLAHKVSEKGVNVASIESVSQAVATKKVSLTEGVSLISMGVPFELTPNTVKSIVTSALKTILSDNGVDKSRFEEGLRNKPEFIATLADLLTSNIDTVLGKATEMGITNFAKDYGALAGMLSKAVMPEVLTLQADVEDAYQALMNERLSAKQQAAPAPSKSGEVVTVKKGMRRAI